MDRLIFIILNLVPNRRSLCLYWFVWHIKMVMFLEITLPLKKLHSLQSYIFLTQLKVCTILSILSRFVNSRKTKVELKIEVFFSFEDLLS